MLKIPYFKEYNVRKLEDYIKLQDFLMYLNKLIT